MNAKRWLRYGALLVASWLCGCGGGLGSLVQTGASALTSQADGGDGTSDGGGGMDMDGGCQGMSPGGH